MQYIWFVRQTKRESGIESCHPTSSTYPITPRPLGRRLPPSAPRSYLASKGSQGHNSNSCSEYVYVYTSEYYTAVRLDYFTAAGLMSLFPSFFLSRLHWHDLYAVPVRIYVRACCRRASSRTAQRNQLCTKQRTKQMPIRARQIASKQSWREPACRRAFLQLRAF